MKCSYWYTLSIIILFNHVACSKQEEKQHAEQWNETELVFHSEHVYENPYTDVDFWVEFTHESGEELVRPGFWDGGNTWKVRFASPADTGVWKWQSFSSNQNDVDLNGNTGVLTAVPYSGSNLLISKGLLRMSQGKRNVIHADGSSFLMVGDTPWALPWRGTIESVTEYARNRQEKGFNTAAYVASARSRCRRSAESYRSRRF